ncbi:MAG: carboxypeptidase regulatory-like domain-containing protein [Planctomycetes bacterium]|nr:carboxypeptidase regulatory-like domain-containing protein [Planctomycetota bacterium]
MASLLFAAFTLYPRGEATSLQSGVVHAAESEASRRTALAEPAPAAAQGQTRVAEFVSAPTELAAPELLRLACRVVDEDDLPVAGAEVWADDGEYALRGLSDADGTFALELDAATLRARWRRGDVVRVGARHADHGPSLLSAWAAPRDAELVLRLHGAGARLWLQVVDPAGMPVPGAQVRVEPDTELDAPALAPDGGAVAITTSPLAISDAWGEVRLSGLEPGPTRAELWAPGYCPRTSRVKLLEGVRLTLRVRLDHAAALHGKLRRIDGGDVGGARVTAFDEDGRTRHETRAGSDGSYELRDVPAGRVRVFAELGAEGRVTHSAANDLYLRAGERGEWNAVLALVPLTQRRLLDSDGRPLIGWRVELRAKDAADEALHVARTDEDGRYELPAVRDGRETQLWIYHALAGGGLPTRVQDDDGSGDGELRLAPGEDRAATLRGRVRTQQGRPALGVPCSVVRLATGQTLPLVTSLDDAAFETPPLPPGDYVLLFPNHGRGWIPDQRFTLLPDEPLDIGSVRLPDLGRLRLAPAVLTRSGECRDVRLVLHRPEIEPDYKYVVHEGRVDLPLEVDLAPGEYAVRALDVPGSPRFDFVITSGATTPVVMPAE